MPSVQTMEDLFREGLKDLYYAEKEILKALDKTMKKTASEELKDAFMTHRSQTEGQIERLERVFQSIEQKPKGKTCQGIRGIIE
jgi:ferritin-like metal-binding protein YciE